MHLKQRSTKVLSDLSLDRPNFLVIASAHNVLHEATNFCSWCLLNVKGWPETLRPPLSFSRGLPGLSSQELASFGQNIFLNRNSQQLLPIEPQFYDAMSALSFVMQKLKADISFSKNSTILLQTSKQINFLGLFT